MSIPVSGTPDMKPPANADATPAVATPPVQPGTSPEARLQAIKDRVKSAMNPIAKPEEKKTSETPGEKPTEEQKPETDLKIPPKVLAELGRLQKRVRELEPVAKSIDEFKSDAELAREVKKLWASDKLEDKLSVLGKISGKDGLDELVSIIKNHYTHEQSQEGDHPNPETKKLMDLIESQNKKIEALEAKDKEKETNSSKASAEENTKRANEYVKGFIDRNKSRFELCSRPENQAEAIELAQDAAFKIIEREKIDIKKMEQKQAEEVYLEALQEVEKEFEQTGQRFSKKTEPARGFNPDRYAEFVRPPSKSPPPVVIENEELSPDPRKRFEQIRARAIAKAEAGLYRR